MPLLPPLIPRFAADEAAAASTAAAVTDDDDDAADDDADRAGVEDALGAGSHQSAWRRETAWWRQLS